jgi:REP element-mobilizing transposase RayT
MELTSFSSAVGKLVYHINFKTKYGHEVFNIIYFRNDCEHIFRQVAEDEHLQIIGLGFDRHHVHLVVEAKLTDTIPNIVKKFKGVSGKLLLRKYPAVKREFFWGSGLWSPAYCCKTVGDANISSTINYANNQGIKKGQKKLIDFFN